MSSHDRVLGDTSISAGSPVVAPESESQNSGVQKSEVQKSETHWRAVLSAEDYRICRDKGTERPFTGKYVNEKAAGIYVCKCCDTPLFDSASKYDSGSGWPSFTEPFEAQNINEYSDGSLGMTRVEIVCSRCDAHLGHVFPDGPGATGMRYCVNSASLILDPKNKAPTKP